jgi:hypothetical protein
MNKLSALNAVVLAAATFVAGPAFAQTTAPLSREAVVADLVAARQSGELAELQGEKGVQTPPAQTQAAAATAKLPRQAVLTVKPAEYREPLTAAQAADHGENASRELGDFPAPIVRRSSALASSR